MFPLRRSSRTLTMPLPALERVLATGQRSAHASHAASRSAEGESLPPVTVADSTGS